MKYKNEVLIVLGVLGLTISSIMGVSADTAITSCPELQLMSANLNGNYYLSNDIDCSATSAWNGGLGFVPIGNFTSPFAGTFDGLGHNINNLHINRSALPRVGMFGMISNSSTIKNVNLTNVDIINTHTTGYTGSLIGYQSASTSVINCSSSGTVSGKYDTGGLVGRSDGPISSSLSSVNVISDGHLQGIAGGLVGGIFYNTGKLTDSYATGDVTCTDYCNSIGGLVGYLDANSLINNTYSTGACSGYGGPAFESAVGGLVGGVLGGLIRNSFTTSTVSNNGWTYLGGLIGSGSAPTSASLTDYWYNSTTSNADWCFGNLNGYYCTSINESSEPISYFYAVANPPISSWSFPPWDDVYDTIDYPPLRWYLPMSVIATWNWSDNASIINSTTTRPCINLTNTGTCTFVFNGTSYTNTTESTTLCYTIPLTIQGNYTANANCTDIYHNTDSVPTSWVYRGRAYISNLNETGTHCHSIHWSWLNPTYTENIEYIETYVNTTRYSDVYANASSSFTGINLTPNSTYTAVVRIHYTNGTYGANVTDSAYTNCPCLEVWTEICNGTNLTCIDTAACGTVEDQPTDCNSSCTIPCGDSICAAYETAISCPADCAPGGGGGGIPPETPLPEEILFDPDKVKILLGKNIFDPSEIFALDWHAYGRNHYYTIHSAVPMLFCYFKDYDCTVIDQYTITIKYRKGSDPNTVPNWPFDSPSEIGFICPNKDECYHYKATYWMINLNWRIETDTGQDAFPFISPNGYDLWPWVIILIYLTYKHRKQIRKRLRQ